MPIKFYLENRPTKKGECMIRVSIMIKSHRLITSIGNGYTITPSKWDSAKQCVKKSSVNSRGLSYAEINNRINSIASEFQKFESEAIEGKSVTVEVLRKLWNKKFGKQPKKIIESENQTTDDDSFYGVFDRFIREEGKIRNWRNTNTVRFSIIKNQLFDFNPNVRFEDVNKEMLADFSDFLIKKKDLVNSTIKKKFVYLRQFFRWAIEQQIIAASPVLQWKPKLNTAPNPVIYLEWAELMKLYLHKFPAGLTHLARVRDCFTFQCFTGLRYSDLYNLKKADIRGNSIFITTQKTNDALEIQLNKYSKSILDKYKKEEFPQNKALPVISNEKMNEALKTICEIVEFNTPIRTTIFQGNKREEVVLPKSNLIATHCGRRTFICNALMLGIAPDIVMKWTGHSDYKAMKPYIEISNKAKAEAMELFNK